MLSYSHSSSGTMALAIFLLLGGGSFFSESALPPWDHYANVAVGSAALVWVMRDARAREARMAKEIRLQSESLLNMVRQMSPARFCQNENCDCVDCKK